MLTFKEYWHVAQEEDGVFDCIGGGGSREEAEEMLIEDRKQFPGAFLLKVTMERIDTVH